MSKIYLTLKKPEDCHFCLAEFEDSDGLASVRPIVLEKLEALRRVLNDYMDTQDDLDDTVSIRVTSALRTWWANEELAKTLGYTDTGGKVSRKSRHMPSQGACAVDVKAYYQAPGHKNQVPASTVAYLARDVGWDKVVDTYGEFGHVHMDMRDSI